MDTKTFIEFLRLCWKFRPEIMSLIGRAAEIIDILDEDFLLKVQVRERGSYIHLSAGQKVVEEDINDDLIKKIREVINGTVERVAG